MKNEVVKELTDQRLTDNDKLALAIRAAKLSNNCISKYDNLIANADATNNLIGINNV